MRFIALLTVFSCSSASASDCMFGNSSRCYYSCNCENTRELCDPVSGQCPASGCKSSLPSVSDQASMFDWRGIGCLTGNVALGKPAEQIGTSDNSLAARAVDGLLQDTRYQQCSHPYSDVTREIWWSLDLQALHAVHNVTLFNVFDVYVPPVPTSTPTATSGSVASTPPDPCASQPCQNGGTCVSAAGSFTCACPATCICVNMGPLCQTDPFNCTSGEEYRSHPDDCQNYIRCVSGVATISKCGNGTYFDSEANSCNHQADVTSKCLAAQPTTSSTTSTTSTTTTTSTTPIVTQPAGSQRFVVGIGSKKDVTTHTECARFQNTPESSSSDYITLTCNQDLIGRYVSVRKEAEGEGVQTFILCEVVVMGYKIVNADCSECAGTCDHVVGCTQCNADYLAPLCTPAVTKLTTTATIPVVTEQVKKKSVNITAFLLGGLLALSVVVNIAVIIVCIRRSNAPKDATHIANGVQATRLPAGGAVTYEEARLAMRRASMKQ